MPLKAYFFILFMGLSLLSVAQPRHIRLVDALSADNFAKHFNTDTVQLSQLNTSKTPAGVFIAYEKADTLNFKHEFYKSFDGPGYTKSDWHFMLEKEMIISCPSRMITLSFVCRAIICVITT